MAKTKQETVAEVELNNDIEASQSAAITVITNTVESLKAHYPKLVTEIETAALSAARPEWMKAERQRLSDLNAAFSDDPKFANESYVAGLSVEQAKAKRHDDLVTRLNDANAKIAQARQEVPFVASDAVTTATAVDSGNPVSSVEAEAKAKWNKDKNIEAEFGSFSTFLAYEKARSTNSFKVLARPEVVK